MEKILLLVQMFTAIHFTKGQRISQENCTSCKNYIGQGISPYKPLWVLREEVSSFVSDDQRITLFLDEEDLIKAELVLKLFCEKVCLNKPLLSSGVPRPTSIGSSAFGTLGGSLAGSDFNESQVEYIVSGNQTAPFGSPSQVAEGLQNYALHATASQMPTRRPVFNVLKTSHFTSQTSIKVTSETWDPRAVAAAAASSRTPFDGIFSRMPENFHNVSLPEALVSEVIADAGRGENERLALANISVFRGLVYAVVNSTLVQDQVGVNAAVTNSTAKCGSNQEKKPGNLEGALNNAFGSEILNNWVASDHSTVFKEPSISKEEYPNRVPSERPSSQSSGQYIGYGKVPNSKVLLNHPNLPNSNFAPNSIGYENVPIHFARKKSKKPARINDFSLKSFKAFESTAASAANGRFRTAEVTTQNPLNIHQEHGTTLRPPVDEDLQNDKNDLQLQLYIIDPYYNKLPLNFLVEKF